jgi:hypothetical protein
MTPTLVKLLWKLLRRAALPEILLWHRKTNETFNSLRPPSMRELYDRMEEWQHTNQKRLLSISIQQDAGKFCCIALTNPSEVVTSESSGSNHAFVSRDGALSVNDGHN